jgi:hypothetical protein
MKRKLSIGVLAGLLLAVTFAFGLSNYGFQRVAAYTAATADTETITAADGQTFSWTNAQRNIIICNAPTSGANIYVKLNADTCNPSGSEFDFVIVPAQSWCAFQDSQLLFTSVTLYADAAVTIGTDVTVMGSE